MRKRRRFNCGAILASRQFLDFHHKLRFRVGRRPVRCQAMAARACSIAERRLNLVFN